MHDVDRHFTNQSLCFSENHDIDMHFTNKGQCFPENPDFHFLGLNNIFLSGGQICEAFIFLEYRI